MHSTPAQDGFKREIFVESDSSLSHFGGLPSAVCFLKRNGLIPSILKRLSDKLPRLSPSLLDHLVKVDEIPIRNAAEQLSYAALAASHESCK